MNLGKNGLTEGFLVCLKNSFKERENIKLSVLKSACRDREEMVKIAEELIQKLGKGYTYRIVGYTIFLKRWRKLLL